MREEREHCLLEREEWLQSPLNQSGPISAELAELTGPEGRPSYWQEGVEEGRVARAQRAESTGLRTPRPVVDCHWTAQLHRPQRPQQTHLRRGWATTCVAEPAHPHPKPRGQGLQGHSKTPPGTQWWDQGGLCYAPQRWWHGTMVRAVGAVVASCPARAVFGGWSTCLRCQVQPL